MNKKEESYLKEDLWLSKILEKPCFNLICREKYNPDNFCIKLPKNNYFISSKVNSYDLNNLTILQKSGFKIVDFSFSLKRNYVLDDSPKNENFIIEEACIDNKKDVAEIALKAFKHSRFHKDSLISKNKAGIIKKEWAKNFFTGQRGDLMLVGAIKNNSIKDFRIKGFLLLKKTKYLNKHKSILIDLIAIDPQFSGLGLGNELIKNMLNKFKKDYIFQVSTQSTNISALSLYSKHQFQFENSFFNLHFHK